MAVGELLPPNNEDPLVGKVVSDRYQVIKKLGEGGMGAVYLAEHIFIQKKVALKVLAPELSRKADLVQRFLQEARSASRIGHENVIDISDFGQSPDGFVFFAMEYLPGNDLGHAIRKGGPMPWPRAKSVIIQVCKALRAAHNQGIVHRDMKPENIFLIEKDGNPDFVKLLDFGIAKVQSMGGEEGPKLTQTGMIFGTPEYMAPEQAEGKVCDARADIYAIGCVMYHVLAGEPPFQAPNFMAMLTKHLLEDPIKPSARRPDLGITPALDQIIMKALVKDRDHRWQTMDEVIAALEAVKADAPVRGAGGPAARPSGPASTKQLGGSDGMPIIATSGRVSNTEMISSDSLTRSGVTTDVIDDADLAPRPRRGTTMPLVIGGLLLGAAVAVGILVTRGDDEGSGKAAPPATGNAETPKVNPGANPPAAGAAAPAVAEKPPAPANPQPAAGVVPGVAAPTAPNAGHAVENGGKKPHRIRHEATPTHRRIELEPEPVEKEVKKPPPGLKTPAELKGFPQ